MVNELIPGSRMYGDMARHDSRPGQHVGAEHRSPRSRDRRARSTPTATTGVLVLIDGFEIRSNTYPDFSSAQEIDVRSFGNSADVAESGSVWNLVSKSGGNQFPRPLRRAIHQRQVSVEQPRRRAASAGTQLHRQRHPLQRFQRRPRRQDRPGQAVVLRRLARSPQQAVGRRPRRSNPAPTVNTAPATRRRTCRSCGR